jgi:hypothetical protein
MEAVQFPATLTAPIPGVAARRPVMVVTSQDLRELHIAFHRKTLDGYGKRRAEICVASARMETGAVALPRRLPLIFTGPSGSLWTPASLEINPG